ncbi:DUF6326 family protein [Dyella sp.]|uniref:DUF6326 family protein n=1 Tax=Dyella sp. TaxID=1869338 RepID=UPI002ED1CBC9
MATPLHDAPVPIRLKLAALWTSLMFCYIYGDYFDLFRPGNLQDMLAGNMGPLGPVTQNILLGTTVLLAIPAVMIFLCVSLPATWNRWVNMLLGVLYAMVMAVSMPGSWHFYQLLGVIEIVISLLITGYAFRWPRASIAAT